MGLCMRRGGQETQTLQDSHPLHEHNTPPAAKLGPWNALGWEKTAKIKPSCQEPLHCSPSGISGQTPAEGREGFDSSKPRAELPQRGDSQNIPHVLHQAHKAQSQFASGLHLPLQVKFSPLSSIASRGSQPQELFWQGSREKFPF